MANALRLVLRSCNELSVRMVGMGVPANVLGPYIWALVRCKDKEQAEQVLVGVPGHLRPLPGVRAELLAWYANVPNDRRVEIGLPEVATDDIVSEFASTPGLDLSDYYWSAIRSLGSVVTSEGGFESEFERWCWKVGSVIVVGDTRFAVQYVWADPHLFGLLTVAKGSKLTEDAVRGLEWFKSVIVRLNSHEDPGLSDQFGFRVAAASCFSAEVMKELRENSRRPQPGAHEFVSNHGSMPEELFVRMHAEFASAVNAACPAGHASFEVVKS